MAPNSLVERLVNAITGSSNDNGACCGDGQIEETESEGRQ